MLKGLCLLGILHLIAVSSHTILGNSILRANSYSSLSGHRVAILTNPTGVFEVDMVHIVDDMNQVSRQTDSKFSLSLILGPEHGFRGEKQAETGDEPFYIDGVTGLPVVSAYSLSVAELEATFKSYNITSVIVDMQDVGVRLYTFIWTMFNVMDAFGGYSKSSKNQFLVCDRPNPNGGNFVDGPMLDMAFSSGYGRTPIPFIHGMTIGELSLLFNSRIASPIENLEVLKMVNWDRKMKYEDTGLPWIPPSPNLPTLFSSLAYGATVFLEATTISEGRGTCTPFTLFGAPFLNAQTLALRLNALFGCEAPRSAACFRAAYFQPTFAKYNNSVVQGAEYVNHPHTAVVNPINPPEFLGGFKSATDLLILLKSLSSPAELFQWDGSWFGHPGTELVDYYAGTDKYRLMIDAGRSSDEIVAFFEPETRKFMETRSRFLLY